MLFVDVSSFFFIQQDPRPDYYRLLEDRFCEMILHFSRSITSTITLRLFLIFVLVIIINMAAASSSNAFSYLYSSSSSSSESLRSNPRRKNGGGVIPQSLVPVQVQLRFPATAKAASHQHPSSVASSSLSLHRCQNDEGAAFVTTTSTKMSISSSNVESNSDNNSSKSKSTVTLVQPPSSSSTASSSIRSKRRNRLKNSAKNNKNNQCMKSSTEATSRKNGYHASSNGADVYLPTSGNLPDPWHGAISMEHLRQHGHFLPLPLATPRQLTCLEDVRQFRQDSWQWHVLHQGRCTTSMAAAALGFLEPTTGQVLGIPPSWRHGAYKAFVRLRQEPVIRTLDEMNALLLNPPPGVDNMDMGDDMDAVSVVGVKKESVWQTPSTSSSTNSSSTNSNTAVVSSLEETTSRQEEQPLFMADYIHQPSIKEMQRRKAYMRKCSSSPEYLTKAIRLYWGNTQEATAMLTALNYFSKNSTTNGSNVTLVEVGMCGAGLELNQSSSSSSLLVGATPDGILHYSDGRIEALEVKNHCPFFSNVGRKRRGGKVKGAFSIGDRPMDQTGILAQYVSQMQLEMLCLGPTCQSAIMVRQSATQGAYIIRMHRDDDWIQEMLYFLHLFQRNYVEQNIKPPTDFFWHGKDDISITKRYRRFVNRTAQLKGNIVAYIPHNEIQRVNGPSPFFLDHV